MYPGSEGKKVWKNVTGVKEYLYARFHKHIKMDFHFDQVSAFIRAIPRLFPIKCVSLSCRRGTVKLLPFPSPSNSNLYFFKSSCDNILNFHFHNERLFRCFYIFTMQDPSKKISTSITGVTWYFPLKSLKLLLQALHIGYRDKEVESTTSYWSFLLHPSNY